MEEKKEKGKRLYRLRENQVIAGVAGGLAEYFEIDPSIARLIFVLLALADGIGIIIYIVLAIVLPEKGKSGSSQAARTDRVSQVAEDIGENARTVVKDLQEKDWSGLRGRDILAIGLILIGFLSLFRQFIWFSWDIFWPVVIILIGIYFLTKKK